MSDLDGRPDEAERPGEKPRVGADFLLPIAGVLFAAYYLYTIRDLPWEARVTGIFVCYGVFILSAIFFVRSLAQLGAGRAAFSLRALVEPLEYNSRRLALLGLVIAFPLVMPYAGLTLTVLLFMAAALVLLGPRSWKQVATISILLAAVNYLLFIVLLRTRFPRGPIEWLLAGVF
jgi:hypothetical protein